MKILVLGGTQFVGRHAVEEALSRGHDVTIFNRGRDSAPKGVTCIIGDRLASDGYAGLDGLFFDAVIDTWAYDPAAVSSAVEALRGRVGHYVYISTISVYNFEGVAPPCSESAPLWDPERTDNKYIKDKVRGEQFALQSGTTTTLIRPGAILGPYENAHVWRLPWWLQRMERGGKVLAPGTKDRPLQVIDARDLAKFILHAAENNLQGAYNALPEPGHITMGQFLDHVNAVTGENAQLCWLESDKVLKAGIKPWIELPMWLPEDDSMIYNMDVTKATNAGLIARPAEEMIADTWVWLKTLDPMPTGSGTWLEPEKEQHVLDKYFP